MNSFSNVDRQEIDKFDRVGQLWWDPAGKMGMLHVINPLRCRFVADHARIDKARALDVGCGGGILAEALAKAGAQVTGIDLSQQTLKIARQHAAGSGLPIDYRLLTVEELAQREAGSYDIVTCMEMLEHVPEPAAVVDACTRLLKPGGQAFFSTINRNLKAWLFAIVGGEYVLRILPRGTHRYSRLVRPDELRAWAAASGLVFDGVASLMYNPLGRRFHVAYGREDVNYMACFTRTRG
ncbi:bifunctional 2-polyprenyl-6-hydroxyphenol methylase/3-demethylubiquinol 3-O-methyltransferase UbiG [Frateuria soli]|uniref:bifunctional 2-polyprenyl-6-hydroxyphenol methylase/3-demethylubiquinol 3-O-methyltransferase UbiG n=1 Tax=Frateuria soli TaxID=1542730 RepID=UPI001E3682C5|nr:bifunctional 2-polyprenyl-6-hydroxyphenol methylase/3-demethylubiquinol 3-O-methyltransferase UbiG [Frateuria soli]UGB39562.1 bifunctional 2-polyprenyl-6-hydroxyphenol methylase/3-demethylubiquinol 3-O-methyltransferase UbiG [Frateuria soli]